MPFCLAQVDIYCDQWHTVSYATTSPRQSPIKDTKMSVPVKVVEASHKHQRKRPLWADRLKESIKLSDNIELHIFSLRNSMQ